MESHSFAPSLRLSHILSESIHSKFPKFEILYEVGVQKVRENFFKRFLMIFTVLAILAKNCPKLTFLAQNYQKWIFSLFYVLRTTHHIFLIFCMKHSLWSRKNDVFAFLRNLQKIFLFGQNLLKFGLNLAISALRHGFSKGISSKIQIYLLVSGRTVL